ncbi:diguanylate cyclase [Arcobacter sp. YIC-464]|uniref:diguanylate cyclase n=1 Tax=Arcobacter sp. YIC-464 TaxID=3376631 RepID=UPI003C23F691
MMPTVEEIAIKKVVLIDRNSTLEEAIKKMADANIRNIVVSDTVEEKHKYFMLTIDHLIDYKLGSIDQNISLKELDLPKAKVVQKDLSILNVLNEVDTSDRYMIILDNHNIIGILSYSDIINNIDPKILIKKQTIAKLILQYKAVTTYENTTTLHTIELMRDNHSDSVIVIDDEHYPIGIFTTKDFINLVHKNSDLKLPIKTHMSNPVYTLNENSTISDALDFIQDKHFKRIVVTNDEKQLVGILTQKELLRIVYNKWIDFIKEEGNKISKINEELLSKTSKLEEKASYDFLTKIYNRQKFDSYLEYEIKKTNRYDNQVLSIMLLDIDYFKNVNDTYGHLVGDKVLKEVAKILTVCSRDCDIVARWGGEEFVLMLPQTNIEQAMFVAQKLRATVEKHSFEEVGNITCSIGISQYHKTESKETLFKRVDEALYKAKSNGRNRVEIEHIDNIFEQKEEES